MGCGDSEKSGEGIHCALFNSKSASFEEETLNFSSNL
jgi:hypothetical protein